MPRNPSKPRSIHAGGYTLRAVRPPTPNLRDWYWRIDVSATSTVVDRGRWPQSEAEQRLYALAASGRPVGEARPVGDCETVYDLLCYWLGAKLDSDVKPRTKDTIRNKKRRLVGTKDSVTRLGRTRIASLDSHDLRTWYNEQVVTHERPTASVADDVGGVLEALRWGRSCRPPLHRRSTDEFDLSWMRRARRTGGRNTREKYTPSRPELAEIRRWFAAKVEATDRETLAYDIAVDMLDLFDLQLGTGARIGELLCLRPCDVLSSPPRLRLGATDDSSKTGARLTGVSDRTHAVARLRSGGRKRSEPLFRWKKTRHRKNASQAPARERELRALTNAYNRFLAAAAKALDLPRVTSHALRRAAVDQYARGGVDVMTAADQLGHSPLVMMARYRSVNADDIATAVEAAKLDALPAGELVDLNEQRAKKRG
jgi:integrase